MGRGRCAFHGFRDEWVQITDGTVEYVKLKDDLSETVGEPKRLFRGSDVALGEKVARVGLLGNRRAVSIQVEKRQAFYGLVEL